MRDKKISAIIACYKDDRAIPILYKRLTAVFKKIKTNYEIIFVNDGSPDNTEKVLRKLALQDQHVIGVNHSRNFSSQMAFTSGMDIASGDCVVLLDGDLQDPPEIIEKFYQKWKEGYDVVYGVREKRDTPFFMAIMYKLFYRVFDKLSYVLIPLDAGDFSLIDRKVVEVLKKFPERDRFLRGLRAWVGFRQIGVPYNRPARMFGETTNNLLKNIDWAIKGIFSFSFIPLKFITFLSLIILIISVITIAIHPISPIITIILFIGSIQLLGISIIGQYIGKIFEEVKQRPKYIVKSVIGKQQRK